MTTVGINLCIVPLPRRHLSDRDSFPVSAPPHTTPWPSSPSGSDHLHWTALGHSKVIQLLRRQKKEEERMQQKEHSSHRHTLRHNHVHPHTAPHTMYHVFVYQSLQVLTHALQGIVVSFFHRWSLSILLLVAAYMALFDFLYISPHLDRTWINLPM